MADNSGISWTTATWGPVTGCVKISPACKHCYAERDWGRLVHLPTYAGRKFTDVACHPERLDQPIRWQRPRMIFVNSMSDLFIEVIPDEFIDRVFAVMALCERHTFQVLTKRPQRMQDYMRGLTLDRLQAAAPEGYTLRYDGMWLRDLPLPNVWLGVSVENQETADERIPHLLETPAAVRWISAEPLLGPVDLSAIPNRLGVAEGQRSINALGGFAWECSGPDCVDTCNIGAQIDWVVAGGESGMRSRPMLPDWARSLRDQCAASETPFFFKQTGLWQHLPGGDAGKKEFQKREYRWFPDLEATFLKTKGGGSDLLDGRQWQEWPKGVRR